MMKATVKHYVKCVEVGQYMAMCYHPELTEPLCRACGNYGGCWTCPPFDYDVPERLKRYEWVLVLGAQIVPDEALRNSPGSAAERDALAHRLITEAWRQCAGSMMRRLEQQHDDSMLLCGFFACEACSKHCARIDGKPCLHPELMRPSLEAYGFDVSKTTSELLGLELKWGSGNALPEYTTLVTALFSHDAPTADAMAPAEMMLTI